MPSSSVPQIALILTVLGLLAYIVGFGAPYWTATTTFNSGLWMHCSIFYDCTLFENYQVDDKFETVRAFEGIGFICTLVALLFSILYSCVSKTSGNKIVGLIGALACFGAAGCILIGVIIYGSEHSNLDWAFGLSTAGGLLFGLAGIVHICAMCKT